MNIHKEHWKDILEEEGKIEKDKAENVKKATKKDDKDIYIKSAARARECSV